MRFWKNNRLDAEFELEPAQVLELFKASEYWATPWPLERSLRAFLTDSAGPISAVWDDDAALEEIMHLALASGWANATAET